MNKKEIEQLKKEIIKDISIFQSEWVYVKFQALYGKVAKLFLSAVESNAVFEQFKGADNKLRAYKLMKYIEKKYIQDPQFLFSVTTLWDLANKIKHEPLSQEFDQSLLREESLNTTTYPKFQTFAEESIFTYNEFIEQLHRITPVIKLEFKINETFLMNDLISTLSDTVITGSASGYEYQLDALEEKLKQTQAKFQELDKKISSVSLQKNAAMTIQKEIKKTKEKKLQAIPALSTKQFFELTHTDEILIYCGNGNQDYGFRLTGISRRGICQFLYPSIYATIHNFLQRASNIEKSTFLKQQEQLIGREVHFKTIYRYEMIILLLIRYGGVTDNTIHLNVPLSEQKDVELAIEDIAHYAELLAKLSDVPFIKPVVLFSTEGVPLSLEDKTYGIAVHDFTEKQGTQRDIWFEPNVMYKIEAQHEPLLKVLLQDFFKFTNFKAGQFDVLKEILNEQQGAICLLPTGGGKSLIFYFAALLSPCPSIIVTPTPILIKDQIRNLQAFHGIDDVFEVAAHVSYNNLPLTNKFIFLTPSAFQDYTLIFDIIRLNVDQKISNVFLDEVHEISNWSHQFKPEYLMLSFNLLTYIDKTKWFAFTATANYKVIHDILNQLRLSKDKIISPIELTRDNIDFAFYPKSSHAQVMGSIAQALETDFYALQQKKKRYLIFTKNETESQKIVTSFSDKLKGMTDVYRRENMHSYQDFAEQKTAILVADKDLGVGINVPAVSNVIHAGIPISKSQFVQEIGRTGREGQQAQAHVYYVSKEHMSAEEKSLLSFNTPIDEIIKIIKTSEDNDLIQAYKNIFGHVEELEKSIENILDIYEKISDISNYAIIRFQVEPGNTHEEQLFRIQSYLYVLYRIGYIYNWFVMEQHPDNSFVEFYIEVEEETGLSFCKKKLNEYFSQIGEYEKNSYAVKHAVSHKELIYLYQEWYYHEFLYHHREQLLNVINFFEYYSNKESDAINKDLANYFSISIIGIEESVELVVNSSIEQMLEKIKLGVDSSLIADLHKAIEYQYNSRIDAMLLFYELFLQKNYNHSRFIRVMSHLDEVDYSDFCNSLYMLYSQCTLQEKFQLMNELLNQKSITDAFELIYTRCEKDLIYYGVMANLANSSLKGETACLTI